MRKLLKTLICALLAFGFVGMATACEVPEFLQSLFNGDSVEQEVSGNPDDDDDDDDDETTDDETTDDETSKDPNHEKGWTKPY